MCSFLCAYFFHIEFNWSAVISHCLFVCVFANFLWNLTFEWNGRMSLLSDWNIIKSWKKECNGAKFGEIYHLHYNTKSNRVSTGNGCACEWKKNARKGTPKRQQQKRRRRWQLRNDEKHANTWRKKNSFEHVDIGTVWIERRISHERIEMAGVCAGVNLTIFSFLSFFFLCVRWTKCIYTSYVRTIITQLHNACAIKRRWTTNSKPRNWTRFDSNVNYAIAMKIIQWEMCVCVRVYVLDDVVYTLCIV